jgi:hypothetical protein
MRGVPADLVACPFMNILVENTEKLEYLTSNNQWTKNAAEGRSFGAVEAALAVAKEETMGQFNIVGYFPLTKQFFNMNHGRGRRIAGAQAD